jgi:predicted acyltransferase
MTNESTYLKDRVASIDALRGLAMVIIIGTQIGGAFIFRTFNNMLWGQYWPHFVTVALRAISNIAQPMFVFVVGVVMPSALSNRLLRAGKRKTYLRIIRRALILYLLGLIAGGKLLNIPHVFDGQTEPYHFTIHTFPLFNNVLQTIGVCYLVWGILLLTTNTRVQYIVTVGSLLLYLAIWVFIPAPGWHGARNAPEMNIGIYIENVVLGQHGAHFSIPSMIILNIIPHIAIVGIGVFVGRLIFGSRNKVDKVKTLFAYAIAMIIVGEIWGLVVPKMGMDISFVLVKVGFSALMLASFYLFIDVWGYSKWAFFFMIFGVNSIAIYMMAHLFDFRLIGNLLVGGMSSLFSANVQDFIQAITALAIMWLIMYYMYIKKTFIKV